MKAFRKFLQRTPFYGLYKSAGHYPDYWYWQLGLVTSVWGLDITLAYTDTNIETSGCGFTHACEGRFFASITKVF